MREIPLSGGYVAMVDDEDYERVSKFKWSAQVDQNGKVYAVRTDANKVYLHRFIMGVTDKNIDVHHRDDNGLNDQKYNLRPLPRYLHAGGGPIRKDNTSGYRGVYYYARIGKWKAQITFDGKHHSLGYYAEPKDAARAYDRAALAYFGEMASLNFPEEEVSLAGAGKSVR